MEKMKYTISIKLDHGHNSVICTRNLVLYPLLDWANYRKQRPALLLILAQILSNMFPSCGLKSF